MEKKADEVKAAPAPGPRARDDGTDRPLVVGVTGGIASGKTAVTRMLEEMGAPVIDFDVVAREVVEPGQPAYQDIVSCFGEQILQEDRTIDRKKLSRIVFQDAEKRKKLEGFTHPRIAMEYLRQSDEIAGRHPDAIIQVAVPLLIEANLQHLFHKILVVYVPRETQIERLTLRDGISREEAERILAAQMPIDEKLRHADFVIRNEGPLEQTRRQVEALWRTLLQLQTRPRSTR
jgi:dephospho-CoA kinase